MNWQPIETYPGGSVLLFWPRHASGIQVGYRYQGVWRGGAIDFQGAEPTHWAPLEPPEGAEYWRPLPMPFEWTLAPDGPPSKALGLDDGAERVHSLETRAHPTKRTEDGGPQP